MSDTTHSLTLPYIMPSQAQKHVTHNEALRMLDALVQLNLLSVGTDTPPASPAEGERHSVGDAPSGAWAGKAGQVAAFQDGAWAFFTPKAGWIAHHASDNKIIVYDGNSWIDAVAASGGNQDSALLGVNAAADETNRLAVSSPATLLTHEGAGHQLKINKNITADTASVLFQTGWSGRAEFGLTGDDDWHVKVSPDGNTFREALIADSATGAISFPNGVVHGPSGQQPQGFIGIPRTTGSLFRVDKAHGQNPRSATIASVAGDLINLTTDDADLFFSMHMAGEVYARIWNTTRSTDQHSAWVKLGQQVNGATSTGNVTFTQTRNDQLQVTDASDLAGWQSGDTIQIGDPLSITPNRCVTYDISPMMEERFGKVFVQAGLFAKYYISGDTSLLTSLQTVGIGLTADGSAGSFNNALSNNQGVAGQGTLYIPCSRPSPISNSNLVSLRENGADGEIKISLVSVLGLLTAH